MCLNNRIKIIQIPYFKKLPFLSHGFGTRHLKENFLNNSPFYKDFSKFFLDQKHSDVIHCIKGEFSKTLEGDGWVTSIPSLLLVIQTADCLPVLLVDINKKVIGAVHCGWRSSGKRILQKTLKIMIEKYSCQVSSVFAALGPCICEKCYEVGIEVFDFFKNRNHPLSVFKPHPIRKKKYFLDLRRVNQLQLQELGVGKERILNVDHCTFSGNNFLSYRRDQNKEGRMLSFIGLSF